MAAAAAAFGAAHRRPSGAGYHPGSCQRRPGPQNPAQARSRPTVPVAAHRSGSQLVARAALEGVFRNRATHPSRQVLAGSASTRQTARAAARSLDLQS
ncbi:hypothetical protein XAP412_240082 [Xanthomonas phaseoli pv. phaseoli]|uniref:Secreted protein n=1 Tax=Xanthomonas campestris pv. phaseoli TaxID=317013 RepID=A0AB38DYU1_XANCH|nr:hypothetical protein XAP412_240082 [Xanthomonas phaseoli pv. phaseoli]SON86424.1 hypothetical protein XAP7430_260081 [Xanthomonas phaseoli pv. phaseoli]